MFRKFFVNQCEDTLVSELKIWLGKSFQTRVRRNRGYSFSELMFDYLNNISVKVNRRVSNVTVVIA